MEIVSQSGSQKILPIHCRTGSVISAVMDVDVITRVSVHWSTANRIILSAKIIVTYATVQPITTIITVRQIC